MPAVQFEDPEGASGSRVTAEVAADLRGAPHRWGVVEEHPLPSDSNEEQTAAVRALEGAPFPCTAAALHAHVKANGAGHQTISLLGGVAKTDAKKAEDGAEKAAKKAGYGVDGKPYRITVDDRTTVAVDGEGQPIPDTRVEVTVYGSVSEMAAAVLAQQIKRVRARASSRTGVIKGGRGPFAPKGAFDSVQRTKDAENGGRVVRVYAMHLGNGTGAGGAVPAFPTPPADDE